MSKLSNVRWCECGWTQTRMCRADKRAEPCLHARAVAGKQSRDSSTRIRAIPPFRSFPRRSKRARSGAGRGPGTERGRVGTARVRRCKQACNRWWHPSIPACASLKASCSGMGAGGIGSECRPRSEISRLCNILNMSVSASPFTKARGRSRFRAARPTSSTTLLGTGRRTAA